MLNLLLAIVLAVFGIAPAFAEDARPASAAAPAGIGPWIETGEASVRLISGAPGPDGGGRVMIGVHIQMTEGWHTYWRSPGDAGLPPLFDWSGSANLASTEIVWPAPRRHLESGLESFVYDDEVVFPVRIKTTDPMRVTALRLKLAFGVCREICIPAEADLALDLAPRGEMRPTAAAALIERFAMRAPSQGDSDDLQLDAIGEGRATFRAGEPFKSPFAILERRDGSAKGVAPLELSPDRLLATVGLGGATVRPGTRLLLIDGDRAIEIPLP